MLFHTLMGMGFLGLALGGFGNGGPSPIGAGVGAPTYGDFMSPVAFSPSPEVPAPATKRVNIPIFTTTDFPFVTIVPDDGTD